MNLKELKDKAKERLEHLKEIAEKVEDKAEEIGHDALAKVREGLHAVEEKIDELRHQTAQTSQPQNGNIEAVHEALRKGKESADKLAAGDHAEGKRLAQEAHGEIEKQ